MTSTACELNRLTPDEISSNQEGDLSSSPLATYGSSDSEEVDELLTTKAGATDKITYGATLKTNGNASRGLFNSYRADSLTPQHMTPPPRQANKSIETINISSDESSDISSDEDQDGDNPMTNGFTNGNSTKHCALNPQQSPFSVPPPHIFSKLRDGVTPENRTNGIGIKRPRSPVKTIRSSTSKPNKKGSNRCAR